jgi:hypothetical protein
MEIVIGAGWVKGAIESIALSPAAQLPVRLVRSTVALGEKGAPKNCAVPGIPTNYPPGILGRGVMVIAGPKLL